MSHPSSDKSLEQILSELDEKASGELFLFREEQTKRLVAALRKCREQRNGWIKESFNDWSQNQAETEIKGCDSDIAAILQGRSM